MQKTTAPTVKIPKPNQTPKVYIEALNDLHHQIGWGNDTDIWDRGKGWISYLQGRILNRVIESKKCRKGDYGRVLEVVAMKEGTAYNCRRISKQYDEKHARIYGYTKMLRGLGWESIDTQSELPDQGKSRPADVRRATTKRTKKITTDNITKHLTQMAETARAISEMPQVHFGRDESRQFYENHIADVVRIRRILAKVEKTFNSRIAQLVKVAA